MYKSPFKFDLENKCSVTRDLDLQCNLRLVRLQVQTLLFHLRLLATYLDKCVGGKSVGEKNRYFA